MIDARVQNLLAEYIRMLIVLFGLASAFVVVQLAPPLWPLAALPLGVLRGIGPIGRGKWQGLLTAVSLAGLSVASVEVPGVGLTLLGLVLLKIGLEVADRRLGPSSLR